MYPISASYESALREPVQHRRLKGSIKVGNSNFSFTEADVLSGSLSITNQCASGSDIKLGAVFVGSMKITFLDQEIIPRGRWKDAEITLQVGLAVDEITIEYIPAGKFIVSEANHSAAGVSITAYDLMAKLDKPNGENIYSGMAYDILVTVCGLSKVTFGMTRAEVEDLPNGTYQLGTYAPNNIDTYRDVVSYIAQVLGGFATFNREGKLEIRTFKSQPNFDLSPEERFKGGKWSDFTTYYTGLSVVNMEDETTSYYKEGADNGLTMNLGANPFLQFGTKAAVDGMRRNILDALGEFRYTPFTAELIGDIAFDLGDVILCRDGIADTSLCCIMSYSYQFNHSYKVQGFGEDPATQGAKSKTDKNISGLSKANKGFQNVFYSYINSQEVFSPSGYEKTTIANIRFVATEQTYVDIWHEFNLDTVLKGSQIKAKLTYLFDGIELEYEPEETWSIGGKHLLTTHYLLGVDSSRMHEWTVKLTVTGGDATLHPMTGRVVLTGQGLSEGKDWSGIIEIEDALDIPRHGSRVIPLNADVSVDVQVPIGANVSEALSLGRHTHRSVNLTDNSYVITREGIYPIVTEDGLQLITEDDNALYTEGGQ